MNIIQMFLRKLASSKMNYIIKNRPLDINIETINTCPLRCCFCCNRIFERPKKIMSLKLFDKICKDYYKIGGGVIGIGAMQSDFLTDPLLIKRLKILNRYRDKFYVYSTTPLISMKKYNDLEMKQILSTFNLLQISVEGLTKEDYRLMSGIDAFDVFQEQIERVYRIIEENKLKIVIHLYFRTYNINKMKRNQYYRKLINRFKERNIRNSFFSWAGVIKQSDLPKGAKLLTKFNSHKKGNCMSPYISLAVMPDGRVLGCGCIDWNATVVVGDLKKQNIREVWKGKKARMFRESFSNGTIPKICEECGLYSPIKGAFKNEIYLKYRIRKGLFYNIGQ